ncbi:MAG: hypothetical protein ACFE0R_01340 [Salinarimonas sp.]
MKSLTTWKDVKPLVERSATDTQKTPGPLEIDILITPEKLRDARRSAAATGSGSQPTAQKPFTGPK